MASSSSTGHRSRSWRSADLKYPRDRFWRDADGNVEEHGGSEPDDQRGGQRERSCHTPRKRAKQLARWRHADGVAMAMHSNQTRSWASLRVSSEILA
jgi:hypothetical protein